MAQPPQGEGVARLGAPARPRVVARPVDEVAVADVVDVLKPLWQPKPEIARKVHQRLRLCFDWAVASQHRIDNSAGSHITTLLGPQPDDGRLKSLPHGKVADALETINLSGAWPGTKLCFAFVVATACRSGEAREAVWDEIDWEAKVWTIPAERTKTSSEHRVPLSTMAMRVLDDAAAAYSHPDGLIFPSLMGGALSDSTMSKLCKENRIGAVPHGFRASFRSWAAETDVDRDVAELCLGHVVHGVEGRYKRSDMLDRRRVVMQRWADYLIPPTPTQPAPGSPRTLEAAQDLAADRYDSWG